MNAKKTISALLAAILVAGAAVGCTPKEDTSTDTGSKAPDAQSTDQQADTSKEVKLKSYFFGDEGGMYADQALDNLNSILKKKINATIDPLMISWADWAKKVPLVYASGEDYDMIYTSDWAFYYTEGIKGPFKDITELLPKYAPKTYAEMQASGAAEILKINDKIYMVPKTGVELSTHDVVYREDLRKKYNCPEITNWDTLGQYYDAIKKNEVGMLPLNDMPLALPFYMFLNENDYSRAVVGGDNGALCYDFESPEKGVFNIVDTPEYAEFVKRQREWYNKGYWSKSILSEQTEARDQMPAGKSASAIVNLGNANAVYQKIKLTNPDWEVGLVALDQSPMVMNTSPASNGTAIGVNSPNPERALMFIELVHQDEEVHLAVNNGIKDVNYALTEDGKFATPEGADPTQLAVRNFGMGLGDVKFYRPNVNDWDRMLTEQTEQMKRAVIPPLVSFVINDESIASEMAAITNVCVEYKLPLDWGTIDPVEGIPTLQEKLKAAGIDKVIAEVNKQIGEHLAK